MNNLRFTLIIFLVINFQALAQVEGIYIDYPKIFEEYSYFPFSKSTAIDRSSFEYRAINNSIVEHYRKVLMIDSDSLISEIVISKVDSFDQVFKKKTIRFIKRNRLNYQVIIKVKLLSNIDYKGVFYLNDSLKITNTPRFLSKMDPRLTNDLVELEELLNLKIKSKVKWVFNKEYFAELDYDSIKKRYIYRITEKEGVSKIRKNKDRAFNYQMNRFIEIDAKTGEILKKGKRKYYDLYSLDF